MSAEPLRQAEVKSVPLFDFETKTLIMEPGVTTVTFFKGNPLDAAAKLRDRFRAIAQANPWLVGRIVRNKEHKNLQLVYPMVEKDVNANISEDLIDQALWIDPPGLSIHADMTYNDIAAAVKKSKANLPHGSSQVNKADLVTRLTIASDSTSTSAFGMIFSMSHVVADGYTYFKIMNMLSSTACIHSLSPIRCAETEVRMETTCKADMTWLMSAGHLCFAICGLVFGRKTKIVARRVDNTKITAAKADAKRQGAEFVSTNDIITSNYGNITDARVLLMALNHRGRVEGAVATEAGNYEGMLAIDKGFYASPIGIRKILTSGVPYKCREQHLPRICETLRGQIVAISNWASFAEGLNITGCEQLLQFPLYETSMVPYDCAIIFKSTPDDLCVMYLTKKYDSKYFSDHAPVSESVSRSIFG